MQESDPQQELGAEEDTELLQSLGILDIDPCYSSHVSTEADSQRAKALLDLLLPIPNPIGEEGQLAANIHQWLRNNCPSGRGHWDPSWGLHWIISLPATSGSFPISSLASETTESEPPACFEWHKAPPSRGLMLVTPLDSREGIEDLGRELHYDKKAQRWTRQKGLSCPDGDRGMGTKAAVAAALLAAQRCQQLEESQVKFPLVLHLLLTVGGDERGTGSSRFPLQRIVGKVRHILVLDRKSAQYGGPEPVRHYVSECNGLPLILPRGLDVLEIDNQPPTSSKPFEKLPGGLHSILNKAAHSIGIPSLPESMSTTIGDAVQLRKRWDKMISEELELATTNAKEYQGEHQEVEPYSSLGTLPESAKLSVVELSMDFDGRAGGAGLVVEEVCTMANLLSAVVVLWSKARILPSFL